MTVNYYIQCPVCSSITRMRSPAGYVAKTPVHIHCGKCNTLLKGIFVSDETNIKAYYEASNCKEVRPQDYDYYGEASGELLCCKIKRLEGPCDINLPPTISPALKTLNMIDIETHEEYIDFACYIANLSENWDQERILFDLYKGCKFSFLQQQWKDEAENSGYPLENEFDVHRYVHFMYIYNLFGVFGKGKLLKTLQKLNYEFCHLDKKEIFKCMQHLDNGNRISFAQGKNLNIMDDYIKISLNIMPALCATLYRSNEMIELESDGITTCSFEDIKNFYLDSYEVLANFCDFIILLDNIKYRGKFDAFASGNEINEFVAMSKGNKIKQLNMMEFFSACFNLSADSNRVRNAIGHNDYSYDGITQILSYKSNSSKPNNDKTIYLLEIAIKCIELMRSSIILEFVIYEFIREGFRAEEQSLFLHPTFYSHTRGQSYCPCGSGKKYTKCCKKHITNNKSNFKQFELPKRSNMRFDPKEFLKGMSDFRIPYNK